MHIWNRSINYSNKQSFVKLETEEEMMKKDMFLDHLSKVLVQAFSNHCLASSSESNSCESEGNAE